MFDSAAGFIFWISVVIVGWTYVGYFIFLGFLSRFIHRGVRKEDTTPPVTMVVTAWNEERRIERKIQNSLEIDYPKDKLDVIIVSDGSSDRTDEIVKQYADRGIKLLRIPERTGKHFGQRKGIEAAQTDIIVLSDATTFLEPDAVRKIVRGFADDSVGVISGEDRVDIEDDNEVSGEGAYVRYEMKLRSFEARISGLIGASGCFFAIRKHLAQKKWIDDMSSDFYMPLVAKMYGMRTIPEHEAIGYYRVVPDPEKEHRRKVRTVLHGLEVLFEFASLMNPFKYGFFAIQIISHKLLRWLVPAALVGALMANGFLMDDGAFYRLTMAAQIVFYALAVIGATTPRLQQASLFRLPFFFVLVNIAIAQAWWQYLKGEKQVVWEATKR